MSYEVEDVSFSQIDKTRFFLMCSLYSFVDAVLFHPPTVAAVVAELHRVPLPQDKNASFLARFRRSFGANLSLKQAAQHIIKSGGTTVVAGCKNTAMLRALYTGFPITFAGLFVYDVAQMLPYNFFKTHLEVWASSGGASTGGASPASMLPYVPMIAGLATNFASAPLSNVPWVLFRQQIQQRCLGQPHDLRYVLQERLPRMEGGAVRVLFRGIFVSLATGVPAAALGWQVYETAKDEIQRRSQSRSVWTSVSAGCVSGAIGVLATRPVGVVVSRMQTDTQSLGFFKTAKSIYTAEGPGAFYKGILARLLSSAPRAGLFFSVYQTLVTWSKIPDQSAVALDS